MRRLSAIARLTAMPVLAALSCLWLLPGAQAETIRVEDSPLAHELNIPLCQWQDNAAEPKGVIVAVHGLTKYGGVFDSLGKHLAAKGFLVVAPDMRGYGHWQNDTGKKSQPKVSYDQSYDDLVALTQAVHKQYPKRPLFCIGESLGADLVVRLTAEHSDLVNGLILASPAIKHHYHFVNTYTIEQVLLCTSNPGRQVNLVPYIKTLSSEDPQIVDDCLKDPLQRKTLTIGDLLRSTKLMRSTLAYADEVPSNVPILIIQGSADRLINAQGAFMLASHLHSRDQEVRLLSERGHILLETNRIPPTMLEHIDNWLKEHASEESIYQVNVPVNEGNIADSE